MFGAADAFTCNCCHREARRAVSDIYAGPFSVSHYPKQHPKNKKYINKSMYLEVTPNSDEIAFPPRMQRAGRQGCENTLYLDSVCAGGLVGSRKPPCWQRAIRCIIVLSSSTATAASSPDGAGMGSVGGAHTPTRARARESERDMMCNQIDSLVCVRLWVDGMGHGRAVGRYVSRFDHCILCGKDGYVQIGGFSYLERIVRGWVGSESGNRRGLPGKQAYQRCRRREGGKRRDGKMKRLYPK